MANNSVSDASASTMEELFAAASAFPYTSLASLTKEITSSKVGAEKAEKTSAGKNTSDFGYNCLLTDFYDFKLTESNEEANLIELKNALDKPYS